jgi:hypothetical protein
MTILTLLTQQHDKSAWQTVHHQIIKKRKNNRGCIIVYWTRIGAVHSCHSVLGKYVNSRIYPRRVNQALMGSS